MKRGKDNLKAHVWQNLKAQGAVPQEKRSNVIGGDIGVTPVRARIRGPLAICFQ